MDIETLKKGGRSYLVMKEFHEEGRLQTVSSRGTARLDHQMAMGLKPIKEEAEKKQRCCRAYNHQHGI